MYICYFEAWYLSAKVNKLTTPLAELQEMRQMAPGGNVVGKQVETSTSKG